MLKLEVRDPLVLPTHPISQLNFENIKNYLQKGQLNYRGVGYGAHSKSTLAVAAGTT